MSEVPDRIEKRIELKASVARVWRALTDYGEFGEWFKVKMEKPFVVGEIAYGNITHPGYEHVRMQILITAMEAERLFAYQWLPYAIDPKRDYTGETPTLVEFRLTATETGTLLVITETGFSKVPEDRRAEAYRMNDGGWAQQTKHIEAYVRAHP